MKEESPIEKNKPSYDKKCLDSLIAKVGDRWKDIDADRYVRWLRGYEDEPPTLTKVKISSKG